MKRTLITLLILLVCFCLGVCGWFIDSAVQFKREKANEFAPYLVGPTSEAPPVTPQTDPPAGEPTESETETVEAYIAPVRFDELQAVNGDIYAWLAIPGSEINYPVVQHKTDREFYLKHNWKGEKDSDGAIFSEKLFNSSDFTDPVTILYGHRQKTGGIFSSLEELYTEKDAFEAHRDFSVYLPDRALDYRVVAALPFDNRHILYYVNFRDPDEGAAFFREVFATKDLRANFDSSFSYDPDGRYLILSSCLWGDKNRRYLVIAQQVAERKAP